MAKFVFTRAAVVLAGLAMASAGQVQCSEPMNAPFSNNGQWCPPFTSCCTNDLNAGPWGTCWGWGHACPPPKRTLKLVAAPTVLPKHDGMAPPPRKLMISTAILAPTSSSTPDDSGRRLGQVQCSEPAANPLDSNGLGQWCPPFTNCCTNDKSAGPWGTCWGWGHQCP